MLLCVSLLIPNISTAAVVKVGSPCKVAKKIVTVKSTKFVCTKVGRVLRWKKYVAPKAAAPKTPQAPVAPVEPVPIKPVETATVVETTTVVPPSGTATTPPSVTVVPPPTPSTSIPTVPSGAPAPASPVVPVVPTTPATSTIGISVSFESTDSSGYAVGGARDFGGAQSSVTADPTNNSNRVMKVVRGQAGSASEVYAGTVVLSVSSGQLISQAGRKTTLRVWVPQAGARVRVKLQDSLANGYRSVEAEGQATVGAAWNSVELDFTNHVAGTSAVDNSVNYRVAVVFVDFGVSGTGQQFYVDDIVFPNALLPTQAPPANAGSSTPSTLLWSEEFNGTAGASPSNAVWTPLLGDGTTQLGLPNYGTGEIVQNTAAAATLDGAGNLVITTSKTNGVWTSARLWTQGKVNFQYGKLEARIRFPAGNFNWPAFWMLGTNYQAPNNSLTNAGVRTSTPWPNSGEIDIAEGLGGNGSSQSTLHGSYADCSSRCTPWFGGMGVTAHSPGTDLSNGFHTFGMLWKPNEIAFTFDGVVFVRNRWEPANGGQILQQTNGAEQVVITNVAWPFNAPFFIIIQNTIPAGTVQPDGTSATMLFDWIRYSSHDGHGALSIP